MKILLIKTLLNNKSKKKFFSNYNKLGFITQSLYTPPLGLLYLARSIKDEGHKVEILDLYLEEKPIEILEKSIKSSDMIGLSVYTDNYNESSLIADFIKEIDKDLPIIIGGPHCIYHPKRALNDIKNADISIEGDGEYLIKDLIKVIEGKEKISNLSGVYYRKLNQISKGKTVKFIDNLDSIPFPDRKCVEKYTYGKFNNIIIPKQKFTSIITSRGCPFNCRFCSRCLIKYYNYRSRSPENVINEFIEINEEFNSVMIVDDNFLTDKKKLLKFLMV